jgi:pilus assembly protein CpaB
MAAENESVAMSTIVVARSALRFGSDLTRGSLRELPWPADTVPKGAFGTIEKLMAGGARIALAPLQENEPILQAKITGPGQRATLSAIIDEGKRAVTVRVNDVNGVAGFVLPGDRVDVLMTRTARQGDGSTTVILQGVRVLAVDQMADERADKPDVAKAVTIEVDTTAAQKIALAASLGSLSLVLRRAGEAVSEATRSITLGDLAPGLVPVGAGDDGEGRPQVVVAPPDGALTTVWVTGADGRREFRVPMESRR